MSQDLANQVLSQSKEAETPTSKPEVSTDASLKPPEAFSKRYDILMRKESALLERQRSVKSENEKLQETLKRIEDFNQAKNNPKKALELLGLNYDELTQSILKDGQIPPEVEIRKLREEWEHERKQRDESEKKRQEEEQRSAQAQESKVIEDFKAEINEYIDKNSSKYKFIVFEGDQQSVYDIIDEHYNRTLDKSTGRGKLMNIAEASDKLEQYYRDKYKKAAEIDEVKALWAPEKPMVNQLAEKFKNYIQPPNTLTNNLSATPTARRVPLTDDERVQRAIASLKGIRP